MKSLALRENGVRAKIRLIEGPFTVDVCRGPCCKTHVVPNTEPMSFKHMGNLDSSAHDSLYTPVTSLYGSPISRCPLLVFVGELKISYHYPNPQAGHPTPLLR